ncbi:hypothetical protein N7488_001621 [Penicillium malachiteum]|nr:hypothetical protein N7488_001621 [Penicillium malachiteum]
MIGSQPSQNKSGYLTPASHESPIETNARTRASLRKKRAARKVQLEKQTSQCLPKSPLNPTSPPTSQSQSPTHQPPPQPPPQNILLLLHGLGDSAAGFTPFGRAINLPETTVLTLQAPAPLPFDLGGFHWGDDVAFDTSTGGLDMDAGLGKSTTFIRDLVRDVLIQKCGYRPREILVLGFGQGGMAGLSLARELGMSKSGNGEVISEPLAGVISIGAPFPLSGSRAGQKNRTPVLLVSGRDSREVSEAAMKRTKEVFEFVEVSRYARKGDGMPSNRDEMLPVMQFFARRLRTRQGVPEGSVELG